MTCVVPSARVRVPSFPVTPAPGGRLPTGRDRERRPRRGARARAGRGVRAVARVGVQGHAVRARQEGPEAPRAGRPDGYRARVPDGRPWPAADGLPPGDPPLAEHAVTTKLAVRTRAAMVRKEFVGAPNEFPGGRRLGGTRRTGCPGFPQRRQGSPTGTSRGPVGRSARWRCRFLGPLRRRPPPFRLAGARRGVTQDKGG